MATVLPSSERSSAVTAVACVENSASHCPESASQIATLPFEYPNATLCDREQIDAQEIVTSAEGAKARISWHEGNCQTSHPKPDKYNTITVLLINWQCVTAIG